MHLCAWRGTCASIDRHGGACLALAPVMFLGSLEKVLLQDLRRASKRHQLAVRT